MLANRVRTRSLMLFACVLALSGCAEDRYEVAAQGSQGIFKALSIVEGAGYSGITSFSPKGIRLLSTATGSVTCDVTCPIPSDDMASVMAVLGKYKITQLVRKEKGDVYMTLVPQGLSRGAMYWKMDLSADEKTIGEFTIVRRFVNGWVFVSGSN